MNFGSWKSISQTIGSSLSELEQTLSNAAQTTLSPPRPSSSTTARPQIETHAASQRTSNELSPTRTSTSSQQQQQHASGPVSPVREQSTSQLASASSVAESFRERLRRQREQQRATSNTNSGSSKQQAQATADPRPSTDSVRSNTSSSSAAAAAPLPSSSTTATVITAGNATRQQQPQRAQQSIRTPAAQTNDIAQTFNLTDKQSPTNTHVDLLGLDRNETASAPAAALQPNTASANANLIDVDDASPASPAVKSADATSNDLGSTTSFANTAAFQTRLNGQNDNNNDDDDAADDDAWFASGGDAEDEPAPEESEEHERREQHQIDPVVDEALAPLKSDSGNEGEPLVLASSDGADASEPAVASGVDPVADEALVSTLTQSEPTLKPESSTHQTTIEPVTDEALAPSKSATDSALEGTTTEWQVDEPTAATDVKVEKTDEAGSLLDPVTDDALVPAVIREQESTASASLDGNASAAEKATGINALSEPVGQDNRPSEAAGPDTSTTYEAPLLDPIADEALVPAKTDSEDAEPLVLAASGGKDVVASTEVTGSVEPVAGVVDPVTDEALISTATENAPALKPDLSSQKSTIDPVTDEALVPSASALQSGTTGTTTEWQVDEPIAATDVKVDKANEVGNMLDPVTDEALVPAATQEQDSTASASVAAYASVAENATGIDALGEPVGQDSRPSEAAIPDTSTTYEAPLLDPIADEALVPAKTDSEDAEPLVLATSGAKDVAASTEVTGNVEPVAGVVDPVTDEALISTATETAPALKPDLSSQKSTIDPVTDEALVPSASALQSGTTGTTTEWQVDEPIAATDVKVEKTDEAGAMLDPVTDDALVPAATRTQDHVASSPPPAHAVVLDPVADEALAPTAQANGDAQQSEDLGVFSAKVEQAAAASRNIVANDREDNPNQVVEPVVEDALVPAASLSTETETIKDVRPEANTDEAKELHLASSSKRDARYQEMSSAYKRLQALKTTLDSIVSNVLPLNGVSDTEAFESELKNMKSKAEMAVEEVRRLSVQLQDAKEATSEALEATKEATTTTGSRTSVAVNEADKLKELEARDERIKELELEVEGKDQELSKAKQALEEAKVAGNETRSPAATTTTDESVEARLKAKDEEMDKLRVTAKEEEEKRVKALSLLRALRQKLVKSEKDREELQAERDKLKTSDAGQQELVKAERVRFEQEMQSMRAAQEMQISKLRQGFERETTSLKAQHDKDVQHRKAQAELDVITLKAANARELKDKDQRVQELEQTVRQVERARDEVFEQLQIRTAEVESARDRQQALESQCKELEYELSDCRDKLTTMRNEVVELRKAQKDVSTEDQNARRLLAEQEARHEAKVRDLEARARQLDKDRQDVEEEMGRNLQDRLKEVERMRAQLAQKDVEYAESVHSMRLREERIEQADKEKAELASKLKNAESMLKEVKLDAEKSARAEAAVREELGDRLQRATELEARLEEVQSRESALRSTNKSLREELRKLQSGVLSSEKQRNPGVGYFSSFNQSSSTLRTTNSTASETGVPASVSSPPAATTTNATSPVASPSGASASRTSIGGGLGPARASADDEAVNFEYLRNVVLQFLERPEMRPQLVSVLGVILQFTPAESRRLIAKAGVKV
ncbi:hypothetical protein ACM66B_004804 [Microbotryomycetes sp. NB124-2]